MNSQSKEQNIIFDSKNMYNTLQPYEWQLILTTGDLKTQKSLGAKIKYVPVVNAVQRFDGTVDPPFIRNGIYFNGIPVAEFEGNWRWYEEKCRLEFDFRKCKVLGFDVTNILSASLKKKAGLLVDDNDKYDKQPAFTWLAVNDKIGVARGAGGGVALWRRTDSLPTMIAPDGP